MNPNRDVKQVIVIRRDLKMRRGKECAQASHASMAFLTKQLRSSRIVDEHEQGWFGTTPLATDPNRIIRLTPEMEQWIESSFTKITVTVNSEAELIDVYNQALASGLTAELIRDSGRTEFHGIVTATCIAIGPNYSDRIDTVTGHLPLY